MTEIDIFTNSTIRLRSLQTPTEAQGIAVIPTPFLIDGKSVLLGIRSQGHLIALFPVDEDAEQISEMPLKLSNSFQLAAKPLLDPDTGVESHYLELSNVGSIDLVLFGAFVDELLHCIDAGNGNVVQEIQDLLKKWKSLLALDEAKTLSLNVISGLLGELLLLDHLLNRLELDALDNWVGPNGNRHDFEFPSSSIEVKTTTVRNGDEIRVNGSTQLVPYPGKSVSILRVKLEFEPNGISLPSLIEKISLARNIDSTKLHEKLSKIGYRSELADSYKSICFQVVEFQIIPVDEHFPRISPDALQKIDPSGRIHEVEYSVNVSGLQTQKSKNLESIKFEGLLT